MDGFALSPYHLGRLAAYLAEHAPVRAAEIAVTPRAPIHNLTLAGRIALALARHLTAVPPADDDGLPPEAARRARLAFLLQSVAEARRPSVGPHDPPAGAIWHATSCYSTEAADSPGYGDNAAFELVQLLFHTVGSSMADACGGAGAWFLDPPRLPQRQATVLPFPRPAARPAP